MTAGNQPDAAPIVRASVLMGVDFVPAIVPAKVPAMVSGSAPASPPLATSRSEPAAAPASEPARPASEPAAPVKEDAAVVAAPVVDAGREAAMEGLRVRHAAECPYCTNATGWTNIVFGEGDLSAQLMFVGEAPGADEDEHGRPFVGRSGQLLDKMLAAIGLDRSRAYIANVLKTRPPNNATPTPAQAQQCGAYLRAQIAIIKPRVIVTLGRPAAHFLLDTRDAMGKLRGVWAAYEGDGFTVDVMPTYHPAYLLRSYTRQNREKVWSDLKAAMSRLG